MASLTLGVLRIAIVSDMPEADISAAIKVLVVDDDTIFRSLLANTIAGFGYRVRSVGDAESARIALNEFDPQLAVVDLSLGEGPTGMDLIQYIQSHHGWVRILVLSAHRNPRLVDSASEPMSEDILYLVKSDVVDVEVLRDALRSTLNREVPVPAARSESSKPTITPNQADVLRMLAEGLSNQAIATNRGCSVRSLERLITRLYESLGIEDTPSSNPRVRAVRMYLESQVDVR